VIDGKLAPALLDRWAYLDVRSQELTLQDRSAIYGGFHIYTLKD
jgi:S-adenosylmethionine-diacylglycerol 3-amino-3-carboxypropyl transferase